jgi:hypothetical protein
MINKNEASATSRTHAQLETIEGQLDLVNYLYGVANVENPFKDNEDVRAAEMLEEHLNMARNILGQVAAGTGKFSMTFPECDDYVQEGQWSVRLLNNGLKIWYGDTTSSTRENFFEIRTKEAAMNTMLKIYDSTPNGKMTVVYDLVETKDEEPKFRIIQQSEETPEQKS